jgi:hypothetical protein
MAGDSAAASADGRRFPDLELTPGYRQIVSGVAVDHNDEDYVNGF